jgi:hypothetical protein
MQKDYVTFVEIHGDKTESQYRSYKQIGGGNVLIALQNVTNSILHCYAMVEITSELTVDCCVEVSYVINFVRQKVNTLEQTKRYSKLSLVCSSNNKIHCF